jgi:hypothetical protein
MKAFLKGLYLVSLLCCLFTLSAQNQSRNWVFSENIGLRFNPDGSISQYTTNMDGVQRHGCGVISDRKGDLLFYAGGFGSEKYPTYNPNPLNFFRRDNGLVANYPGVTKFDPIFTLQHILPIDTVGRMYYMMHMEWDRDWPSQRHMLLCLSELDLHTDNGMGAFTQHKRIVLNSLSDTLLQGMTPIRHANGRDWWMICHQWGNDTFVVAYIGADRKVELKRQRIGSVHSIEGQQYGGGNLGFFRFDADRNKLIVNNGQRLFEILDFDRCTGTLSNPQTVISPISLFATRDLAYYNNVLSPSGRYLYISSFDYRDTTAYLLQYDLNSPDIPSSKQVLFSTPQKSGGFVHHLGLAPDGKIYAICNTDTLDSTVVTKANMYYLSIIEHPDLPYPACNFIPRGLWLQGKIAWSGIPDQVDYDLGPVIGSICDTLGIRVSKAQEVSEMEVSLYPNPANHTFTLRLGSVASAPDYTLRDMQGRIVQSGQATHGVPVTLLPDILSCVYMLEVHNAEKVWHHRLVLLRE